MAPSGSRGFGEDVRHQCQDDVQGVGPTESIVCLGGGVGATRLWRVLAAEVGEDVMTIVVNMADDMWHYGLRVCPDVDSVFYGLSDKHDDQRGWGRRDESFVAMTALGELGEHAWFNLGDRDLATHLLRTELLRRGLTMSQITSTLAEAHGLRARIMPMCDQEVMTRVRVRGGDWLTFQEFHVMHRAEPEVEAVDYYGIDQAVSPTVVLDAIERASLIVIGPSNPFASVMPILGVGTTRDALQAAKARKVAITPVVSGTPIVDPGDAHRARCRERLMAAHGLEHRASAVASLYAGLVEAFVIDVSDPGEVDGVAALGIMPIVSPTLTHRDPTHGRQLAEAIMTPAS